MPASGGRFGVNDPPPAAMTMTFAKKLAPASVSTSKPPSTRRERVDALPEMKDRRERLDLLQKPAGQSLPGYDREPRNIVDRLLGIELRTLTARLVQDVDDVCFHVQKPKLEDGK